MIFVENNFLKLINSDRKHDVMNVPELTRAKDLTLPYLINSYRNQR